MEKKFSVLVYGDGSTKLPTATRYYDTCAAARRYQDAQIKRGIVAVVQRTGAAPVRTNQHGSW